VSRSKWRVIVKIIGRLVYGGANEIFDLIVAAVDKNGLHTLRGSFQQW